jgi:hypothetical protein
LTETAKKAPEKRTVRSTEQKRKKPPKNCSEIGAKTTQILPKIGKKSVEKLTENLTENGEKQKRSKCPKY